MKMNINKACDLNSISVFPPNLRRRSAEPQASQQLRSQQSQQSFSQGPSSQRGCGFSQMTQSSVEDILSNDQRFSSQERDLSFKKVSCLPPINHKREDSQLVSSRSSSVLTRRWASASVGESKSQISEELEQRFGVMETSLTRFGIMLDSIQSDIMQANRGTKEVFLEIERIQQKLILQDTSLQQLICKQIEEQADAKASFDGGVKSILEEFSKDPSQEKLQKICLMLTAIPEQIETALQKIQREICHTFTREIQVLASLKMSEPKVQVPTAPQAKEDLPEQRGPAAKVLASLKMPEPRVQVPTAPQAKENLPEPCGPAAKNSYCNTTLKTKQLQLPRNPSNAPARAVKTFLSPKIQVGSWKTVKPEQRNYKKRAARKSVKSEGTRTQFEQRSVIIDSDEDIDGGFSCLIDGNTQGANFEWDAEKETERILRTARRTKRKFGNPIIIN